MQKPKIALWAMILAYIGYFSWFTVVRWKTLYASYFDLGIMHQAVYNTYRALATFDVSRVLEITDPLGTEAVKRMAVHNDLLLALLAPFYFIRNSPSTLVVAQTLVLASGAFATYNISRIVFKQFKHSAMLSMAFAFSYLMYVPMQQSNIFDFHAVTFATSFLLWMYYFYLTRQYRWSITFFVLSILAKEQVALTTMMFGLFVLGSALRARVRDGGAVRYGAAITIISIIWFILSVFVIIPYFRGGDHFAAARYSDLGSSPADIILTVLTNPPKIITILAEHKVPKYLNELLGPLGFISLLSPVRLLIALPELAINTLSNNGNMRNIIFHYTAVIQPFVFISAIYGVKRILKKHHAFVYPAAIYLVGFTLWYGYMMGPLPFQKQRNIHPVKYPQEEWQSVARWSEILRDESLAVSTTGHYAPYFTNRRRFYNFSERYELADYILVSSGELRDPHSYSDLKDEYAQLAADPRYELVHKEAKLEVYRRR